MLIDPKSITKEQAEKFAELMDEDFGRFLHDYQSIPVASFANALIEAGIVSPPNAISQFVDGGTKMTPLDFIASLDGKSKAASLTHPHLGAIADDFKISL